MWISSIPHTIIAHHLLCAQSIAHHQVMNLIKHCYQLEFNIAKYPNSALWIDGDANLPDINWSIYQQH